MRGLPAILVVEDDHLIQSVLEDALKEGGFEVVIASTGEQAAELLDSAQGKYRALVTESISAAASWTAGKMARRARDIDSAFPVVYMSGDSAEDWASKGVPNSIMLTKPFAPAQLVTAVAQLLNGATPAA